MLSCRTKDDQLECLNQFGRIKLEESRRGQTDSTNKLKGFVQAHLEKSDGFVTLKAVPSGVHPIVSLIEWSSSIVEAIKGLGVSAVCNRKVSAPSQLTHTT